MKLLLALMIAATFTSCNEQQSKDYVSIKGTITNQNNDLLTILGKDFKKEIKVNEDGTYQDTLKVVNGFHGFNDGVVQAFFYLKNGYDIEMNFDAKDIANSISFSGNGGGTNEYLQKKVAYIQDNQLENAKVYFALDKPEFDERIAEISADLSKLLDDANDMDPEVYEMEKANNLNLNEFYTSNYASEHGKLAGLKKGDPSPKFNYPNTNGVNVSLDDLKGKYVYVDVWATWCGPCKQQIPFLKELHDEYSTKNIAIVSLSIDKPDHKEKWLKMVADEELTGIQIMANDGDFAEAYNISGIPRFILIDPEGNIVDSNAPRPSDPKLKQLFNSLNL